MIEAAVEVGFADLSVKRVADRLGVGPTALYHHVANLHDLHVAAGEHVMSGLELPQGAPSARAYLEELARSLRSLERRHPGIGAFCASDDPDAVTTQVTIEAAAQGLAELEAKAFKTDGTPQERLRANWLSERPHPVSYFLAQIAWLHAEGLPLVPGTAADDRER